jgi:hypothetical protein
MTLVFERYRALAAALTYKQARCQPPNFMG